MNQARSPVHSDPEILGSTPVFVGTRVPFQALVEHLEGGESIDEFLEDFPSVTREQAIESWEAGRISFQRPTSDETA